MLPYYMVGSNKLFSDVEVPIQNMIAKKIDKVFKLVEFEKSEIDKFAGKAGNKSFYNKPGNSGYKKKNTKAGLGYKKNNNQTKRFEKTNFQKKMNFVHETSSKKEKELRFSRQTNEKFYAQKKQQQAKDVSKHVLNVNKLGTLAKLPKFEPKQIWKQKVEESKRNIQNDSRLYEKNVSKGQIWVVKKQSTSVDEKRKINSTKKVDIKNEKAYVKNEKDFPKLNKSYCIKIPKVKLVWVTLFKLLS
ncbi:hypothetical protein Hanom_Chr05g00395791 [Helianthus anomalus]